MNLTVCVISAGRPGNVPKVKEQFPGCWWYVPAWQVETYKQAGAGVVRGVEGTLPMKGKQLNTALREHWGHSVEVVATVDDDIVRCIRAATRDEAPLQEVVRHIAEDLIEQKLHLGGPYSGTNTSWAPKELRRHGLIPGAMMVHRKGSGLWFDEELPSMEDLDFCIAHHAAGGTLLHGHYCLENLWEGNAGGYQDCRTIDSKKETVRRLKEKWERLGCFFEFDEEKKNKIRFRIPWKRIVSGGKPSKVPPT